MEDSCSRVLSVELTEVFREGIGLIFKLWPVLQAAIKMELGGTSGESLLKSQRLVDDVISWFSQPQSESRDICDVGKLILKRMISYFDVDAFDGTHEMIAVEIMDMHDQLLEGDFCSIDKFKKYYSDPAETPIEVMLTKKIHRTQEETLHYHAIYRVSGSSPAASPSGSLMQRPQP